MSEVHHLLAGYVTTETDTGVVLSAHGFGGIVHDYYDDDEEEEEVKVKEKRGRSKLREPAVYEAMKHAPTTCNEDEKWHVTLYNFGPVPFYKRDSRLLTLQIKHYFDANIQTRAIYDMKMKSMGQLQAIARKTLGSRGVRLFPVGSTLNGCGARGSDLDVCMLVPRGDAIYYKQTKRFTTRQLALLKLTLENDYIVQKLIPVLFSRVPVMKLLLNNDLDVDINCNNVECIYNSHLVSHYTRLDTRFPMLVLIVKRWALVNGINDSRGGMINGFSLVLLVLHYLQCGVKPAVLPNLQALYPDVFTSTRFPDELRYDEVLPYAWKPQLYNNMSVGDLLLGFFEYYTRTFDFSQHAVSIRQACVIARDCMPKTHKYFPIFVEEPYDCNNTALCVQARSMPEIMAAFVRARDDLSSTLCLNSIGFSFDFATYNQLYKTLARQYSFSSSSSTSSMEEGEQVRHVNVSAYQCNQHQRYPMKGHSAVYGRVV